MKNKYLKYTLLSIAISSSLLLTSCGCGKKSEPLNEASTDTTAIEETTTGITKEQLLTLLENAESVYAENPELFTEEIDSSIFDLPEIKDAELPVLEAITIKEAFQIVKEDNIPEEILDDVAKQVGLVTGEESRWDEAITKNEALNFILRIYENMETVTNADRGQATGNVIEAPETENTENSISGVDSTGSDVQIDEGDYVEPSVEDNAEAADKVANNGMAMSKDEALADAQRWLDEGLIDEAGYQELLELIEDTYAPKPSQPSQQPSYGQIQLTPEQQAAADAMDTTGQGDQRTDIQYGQGDYTGLEHIRIN